MRDKNQTDCPVSRDFIVAVAPGYQCNAAVTGGDGVLSSLVLFVLAAPEAPKITF